VSERDPNRDAAEEVDAYLAALQCVREQIHAMAHGVTERVSNRIPMFRLHRDLSALSAPARHLSLHTLSRELAERLATRLPGLTVSGATIQFTPEHPVPQEVVETGGAPLAQPVWGKGRPGRSLPGAVAGGDALHGLRRAAGQDRHRKHAGAHLPRMPAGERVRL